MILIPDNTCDSIFPDNTCGNITETYFTAFPQNLMVESEAQVVQSLQMWQKVLVVQPFVEVARVPTSAS